MKDSAPHLRLHTHFLLLLRHRRIVGTSFGQKGVPERDGLDVLRRWEVVCIRDGDSEFGSEAAHVDLLLDRLTAARNVGLV